LADHTKVRSHIREGMKMDVVVASHPSALLHDTGPGHPERAARVEAVLSGVRSSGLDVSEITSPPIARSELALVHDPSYIAMVETFCELGGGALDIDTFASRESWEAALTAAGGVRALVEELEPAADAVGFAITRPPGHHALRDRAMGFCIFNNVAVTAAYLRSRGERVAILDWDVHHGNGTQACFADDPGTLYVSIHQDHFYPFSGQVDDIEEGDAKGTTVNIPLMAGTTGDIYRRAWEELVIPVVSQFEPSWVLVSSGFDAYVEDHMAALGLVTEDYGWIASKLGEIHPHNRTILALEGGYDLEGIEGSTTTTLRGLAGLVEEPSRRLVSPPSAAGALDAAAAAIARHWKV
jgi:acetoin utilization deacetylase AcuC-like enzyme